jgi:translation initiation factor 5
VENQKAQKYLLIGFEKLLEKYEKQLLPKAAHILKSFYDEDILEEEVILGWADRVCFGYCSSVLGLFSKG